MNTVKRWLAGFLSFAMIFTSAGFTQLGAVSVFAADKNVATVKVGTDTKDFADFDKAIQAANAKSSAGKEVTITLLNDTSVEGVYWIAYPMVIELKGYKLADNEWILADYDEGLCRGETYANQKLTKITYAAHAPSYKYNWTTDTEDGLPDVESIEEVCSNCGTDILPATGSVSLNTDTWKWEYKEDGEVLSSYDEKKGYVLAEGSPEFETKMGEVVYKDGLPVVTAELIRKSDKAKVAPKSIAVEKANDFELGRVGKRIALDEDMANIDYAEYKLGEAEENLKAVLEDVEEATSAVGEAQDLVDTIKAATKAVEDADQAMKDALKEGDEAAKALADAQKAIADAEEAVTNAQKAFNDANANISNAQKPYSPSQTYTVQTVSPVEEANASQDLETYSGFLRDVPPNRPGRNYNQVRAYYQLGIDAANAGIALTAAKEDLETAKEALPAAQQRNILAEKAVRKATEEYEECKEELDALPALADAEQDLADKTAALDDLEQPLSEAREDVRVAQNDLEAANNKFEEDLAKNPLKFVDRATGGATCTQPANNWFHVTVTAPDDVVVYDGLMNDPSSSPALGHVKGRLYGLQFLVKSRSSYDTEYDAFTGAERNGRDLVKITEETDGYHYWYWTTLRTDDIDWTNTQTDYEEDTITRYVARAIDINGTFSYRPVYSCDRGDKNPMDPDEADIRVVKPYDNATTSAQYNSVTSDPDSKSYGTLSTCTFWNYNNKDTSVTCEYTKMEGDTVKSKKTIIFTVTPFAIHKDSSVYSHKSDGTYLNVDPSPTHTTSGIGFYNCAICHEENLEEVLAPTGEHDYGVYPDDPKKVTVEMIDPSLTQTHTKSDVTLENNKSVVTINPTCTEAGGKYMYCKAGGGHWALVGEPIAATGHKFSTTPLEGSYWSRRPDYENYDKNEDYVYYALLKCENDGCDYQGFVNYHSREDGQTTARDIYGGVTVEDQDIGADCRTQAKIIYKVKDLKDKDGKEITKEIEKGEDTVGPHKPEGTNWTWTGDYKKVVIEGKCTVCGRRSTETTIDATQETAKDGITTFTATYEGQTKTEKAFSLVDAVVTYDTSLITDGNLVNDDTPGAAQQVPDVTVTINGTVIDPDLYKADWSYDAYTREVNVVVDWTDDVKASTAANHVAATASAAPFNVEAKNKITKADFKLIDENKVKVDEWDWDNLSYDPAKSYSLEAKINPSDATVKYAVYPKAQVKDDDPDFQKKIEALDYSIDSVKDIKAAGDYYIYAQITKEGYTTFTTYVGLVSIDAPVINVFVDPIVITEGETPDLKKQAYDVSTNKPIEVDWTEFKFYAAGGTAFEDLKASEEAYLIIAEAPNYVINNNVGERRVGTIVVKAKTDVQKAAEEIIKGFKDADTDDKLAAAYAAYLAITDKDVKELVDAAIAADKDLAAKVEAGKAAKEAADKKAEEEAKKAAEEAAKKAAVDAANAALAAANAYASDATIKALIDALNAAIKQGDTAAIQKATTDLNNAVASKKAAPAKKSTPSVKISTKSKTYKAKDLKKKAKSFKIKYSKTSGSGKATFKKSSGSKKLKVSKAGKITVKKGTKKGTYKIKVKLTVAANSKFNAKTVKKTIKVKVK